MGVCFLWNSQQSTRITQKIILSFSNISLALWSHTSKEKAYPHVPCRWRFLDHSREVRLGVCYWGLRLLTQPIRRRLYRRDSIRKPNSLSEFCYNHHRNLQLIVLVTQVWTTYRSNASFERILVYPVTTLACFRPKIYPSVWIYVCRYTFAIRILPIFPVLVRILHTCGIFW